MQYRHYEPECHAGPVGEPVGESLRLPVGDLDALDLLPRPDRVRKRVTVAVVVGILGRRVLKDKCNSVTEDIIQVCILSKFSGLKGTCTGPEINVFRT